MKYLNFSDLKLAHLFSVFFLLLLMSCSKHPERFIEHLNGYWEIEQVIMADGVKREFKVNQTIDYIFVTDSLTGFRKKLQPNFQGTFVGSDDVERFTLSTGKKVLKISYSNNLNTWTENVIFANKEKLIIVNDAEITYKYKRYQPININ